MTARAGQYEPRPYGYFLHHQGCGHAERCGAILDALPSNQPVTVFCTKPDILTTRHANTELIEIPSLFEPTGRERSADWIGAPETVHCAPVGWPGIRTAMGEMAAWFAKVDPALMICDVSAEVAQLARLCSVPHVKVLQHGDRSDPGHRAAYEGAAGLIVPSDERLRQGDWSAQMCRKAVFAGGLGVALEFPSKIEARARLGLSQTDEVILIMSGGGGTGFASAPLGVGARAQPDACWITIGTVSRDWHATEPSNLSHRGWVENVHDYLAAADIVVASTGNTTCQMILAAGRPWVAVPEWRYFDEQIEKAKALQIAGAALHVSSLPASAQAWAAALARARAEHDPALQQSMVRADAAEMVAEWLSDLTARLETPPIQFASEPKPMSSNPPQFVSVLTLAKGRAAHLHNVIKGLTRQSQPPVELIIGVMQDAEYTDLPAADFPIRQIKVVADELPLAKARNTVAAAAEGDVLVFLDVDCIPHADLVRDYAKRTGAGQGLTMGEVLYLPAGATDGDWTDRTLGKVAVRHSDRQGPPIETHKRCEDYRCFWSLSFAMHRDDWSKTGGFDERFTGYGGEDTDFGRTLEEAGIPIWWISGARAFHQHHDHCMPPIHHVASILRNTEIFAEKWGHRTMEHWLRAFRLMGLIEDGQDGLRQVREPGPKDFDLCRQRSDMPYAASADVLQYLEEKEREDAAVLSSNNGSMSVAKMAAE